MLNLNTYRLIIFYLLLLFFFYLMKWIPTFVEQKNIELSPLGGNLLHFGVNEWLSLKLWKEYNTFLPVEGIRLDKPMLEEAVACPTLYVLWLSFPWEGSLLTPSAVARVGYHNLLPWTGSDIDQFFYLSENLNSCISSPKRIFILRHVYNMTWEVLSPTP